jgi:serine/threonine protein kinase
MSSAEESNPIALAGPKGAANLEGAATEDSAVVRALREYWAAQEAGRELARPDLLARYPEIAAELSACLDALDFVRQTGPKREPEPAAAPAEESPAARPLGDYRILREVGRGGMGVVYEAEQLSLGRRVALKVLPFAAALDPKHLQRFKNEAQAAAHLHHQHIVPVYSVGCERGVHFYAMQYIEGQTLAALIQELRRLAGLEKADESPLTPTPLPWGSGQGQASAEKLANELVSGHWAALPRSPSRPVDPKATVAYPPPPPDLSRLTPDHSPAATTPPVAAFSTDRSTQTPAFFRTVANLGIQAAEGLEHAHQMGVIHRDIKPGNMLVDTRGNLWITDFGLAQVQGDAKLTMTGDVLGTIRYMSPEQALAQRAPVDHRTDVYSLGVTLYELMTLEPAFQGRDRRELFRQIAFEEPRPPRRVRPAVPTELETIVLKAMAKNPAERYATAQELADDLERFLDDRPIRARCPTYVQRARKFAWRHLGIVLTVGVSLVGLLLVIAVLLGVGMFLLSRKQEEIKDERNAATQAAARAELANLLLSELLSEAAPDVNAQDKKLSPAELFQQAVDKITKHPRFAERPEVEAALHLTIGSTYKKLGELTEADKHLRRAVELRRAVLGPENLDTLAAQEELADFLSRELRKPAEAEPWAFQTWEARRRLLGDDNRDTLNSMATYGMNLYALGRLDDAERIMSECYEAQQRVLGKEDEQTLTSLNNLSGIVMQQGKWEEAEPLFREILRIRQEHGMEQHSSTLITLSNLCYILTLRGGTQNLDEAIERLTQGLKVAQQVHGKENPTTLYLHRGLIRALTEQGQLDKAETIAWEALPLHRHTFPVGHEHIGRALALLGRVLTEQGKPAEGEPLLREAADLFRKHSPSKQDLIAETETWLGACLTARGRYEEAETFSLRSYNILKAAPAVPPRDKEAAKQRIVKLYDAWGKPDKAAEWRAKQ